MRTRTRWVKTHWRQWIHTCRTTKVQTRSLASPTSKLPMEVSQVPKIHGLTDTLSVMARISPHNLFRPPTRERRCVLRLISPWWRAAVVWCPNYLLVLQVTITVPSMQAQIASHTLPWGRRKTTIASQLEQSPITISWRETRGIQRSIRALTPPTSYTR